MPATAKDAVRAARTLYSWDFLLGVQDITRQGGHHTFCVQRFDRTTVAKETPGKRRFYTSAMTLLGKDVSEGTSYL
ncbi:MAG: hypothetical protein AB1443_05885 [Pseudomonadota bacterium]